MSGVSIIREFAHGGRFFCFGLMFGAYLILKRRHDMKLFRKKYAWAAFYTLILTAFTAYVLLDALVIPRSYAEVVQATANPEATAQADTVITEDSYSDGNMTVTITEYRVDGTSVYVADIVLSSADALKTAFAQSTYGKNVKEATSEIAAEAGAVLAINGDFYGARNSGYVIRNGVLYRSKAASASQEDLVIYKDGSFEIVCEGDVTAEELLEAGAQQVFSFGPALVADGEIAVTSDSEVDQAMTSNPRTAIGIIDSLHYVMVVSDGRTSESAGLTLMELATFMREELGVTTAYNLDGGGSSTMWFNGQIINNPTDGRSDGERSVSDIVYIG